MKPEKKQDGTEKMRKIGEKKNAVRHGQVRLVSSRAVLTSLIIAEISLRLHLKDGREEVVRTGTGM